MNQYFDLIATEFAAQSAQIKQFVKSHGPSIGSAHEVMLRSFLKKYLPKWVSIGHGFVLSQTGSLSRECDIIVYNSTYYSPLYQIEDFVVLAPESVIWVVEVKTVLSRKMLHDSLDKLIAVKKIRSNIETALVVFRPPSLETTSAHIETYDFTKLEKDHIPDQIFCLSKYHLQKMDFVDQAKRRGVAFISSEGSSGSVFEYFYHCLYQRVEMEINKSIKEGIDNILEEVKDAEGVSSFKLHGRMGYSGSQLSGHKLAAMVQIDKDQATDSATH